MLCDSEEPSQRDGSLEHPKHMFKLMVKKIITNLCSETLLIRTYDNDIVYPDIIFCNVANVDHPPGIYSNSIYRLCRQ